MLESGEGRRGEEGRAKEAPREEGGAGVRDHAGDAHREAAVELEDGEAGEHGARARARAPLALLDLKPKLGDATSPQSPTPLTLAFFPFPSFPSFSQSKYASSFESRKFPYTAKRSTTV